MESSVASSPHSHLRPESPHPGCASAARPPHLVGRRTSLPTRAAQAQPDLPTSWAGARVSPPGLRERSPPSPLRGEANESPHPGCASAARPPHFVGRRTRLPTRAARAQPDLPASWGGELVSPPGLRKLTPLSLTLSPSGRGD